MPIKMKPGTIGDGPIDKRVIWEMNAIARAIDVAINGTVPGRKPNGFVLMVFPFAGHEGRCNYISNAEREDIIVLLKEQLARFEGMAETKGTA